MSEVPLYPAQLALPLPPARVAQHSSTLQGYLANKKHPPPRTLQYYHLGSKGG